MESNMMEKLLVLDVDIVYQLQKMLHPSSIEGLTSVCSQLGDPRYSYLITFPVMYWLAGPFAGGHILTIAAFAEWLNITLKWVLRGNRPFWWVGENRQLWTHSEQLIQVPITCETGPGNPSGHVMVTLAVLLACTQYIESKKNNSLYICKLAVQWCIGALAFVIGLTRVLVSSHFLHQIVAGILVGLALHYCTTRSKWFLPTIQWTSPTSAVPLFLTSFSLLLGGFFIYYSLVLLGLDPSFSVSLALKHCSTRSWVHLNTTPHYSLVRSSGAILGMGVVSTVFFKKKREELHRRAGVKRRNLVGLVLSCVLIAVLHHAPLHMAGDTMIRFYAISMCKAILVPVMTVLPAVYIL